MLSKFLSRHLYRCVESYGLLGIIGQWPLPNLFHLGDRGGKSYSLEELSLFELDQSDVRIEYELHGSSLGFVSR